MAPAKKKVTNKSKDKYSVNTAESQTNLDNIDNTNSVNSDDILTDIENTNNTFNLDNIDNEVLRSLKHILGSPWNVMIAASGSVCASTH